jgi:hypothetical protein
MSTPDPFALARALIRQNREMSRLIESLIPEPEREAEPELPKFDPTSNQQLMLKALEGVALTTDALSAKSGVGRRQIFQEPKGGIQELMDEGLVEHRRRQGYFRPDSPPASLRNSAEGNK